jgi:drug/metabolite transporter (DMT)-like permease
VSTQPVWAALLGRLFLRERVETKRWLGIGLAILGLSVATGGVSSLGRGELYALAGAILAAGYIVTGRHQRQEWEILPYLLRVYGWAALTLLLALWITRTPAVPKDAGDWWVFAFLALVPTGVGHSLYNYSLKHLPAYAVATAITAEPLGAALLAYGLFGEVPERATLAAAPLVVVALWLVVRPVAAPPVPSRANGL